MYFCAKYQIINNQISFIMKKKNILISLFAMVFVAMTALCITSCDKDDVSSSGSGNGGGGNTPTNSIVGTWKGDITEGDQYEVAIVLKIRNDNTGTLTVTETDYYGSEKYEYDLTYKMTSNDEGYAFVEFDDYYSGMEYERYDFELNGNIMYVYYDDDYYYGDELICVLHKQ